MHLWYTNLMLVTLGRLSELIIGFLLASLPYLPYFRSLALPHGLEDALVVNQLDHGHFGEVRQPHHWLSHGQYIVYYKQFGYLGLNKLVGTRLSIRREQTITIPALQLRCRRKKRNTSSWR